MPFVRFLAASVRTACVSVLSAAAREETAAATLCFSQLCERLLTSVRKIVHRCATVFAHLCDVFLTLVRILSHSRATTYSRLCDAKCRGESSLFRRSRCFFRAENSERRGEAFFCATSANFVSRKANFVLQKAISLPFLTIFIKRCDSTFFEALRAADVTLLRSQTVNVCGDRRQKRSFRRYCLSQNAKSRIFALPNIGLHTQCVRNEQGKRILNY